MEQSTQEPSGAQSTMTPSTGVGESGAVIPAQPQPPSVEFSKVDNNLTGIGFFTASSKRSRKAIEKTTVVIDRGIEHRISILPSAKYGLPITQDQDFWLALMKLVSEHIQREGKLTNPFTFTTAQLIKILGQTDAGKNYKAVDEWLSVMKSTAVEGGVYNAARREWYIEKTGAVDRVVMVGKKLPDGTIADRNYVWFSQWQLDNINAGNLLLIEMTGYRQLQNNIAKNLVPYLQEWLFVSQHAGRFEKQYEDICQLLGIRVYQYRSDIERKLGPSLDELATHGYISKWAIEEMADGKSYKLVLFHGPKYHSDRTARLERKHRSNAIAAGEQPPRRPRQKTLLLQPEVDGELLQELTGRGVGEPSARKLLAELPEGFAVRDILEWADEQLRLQPGKFTNPAGFVISLIRDRFIPPPTFETSRQKQARHEADLKRQQAIEQQYERARAQEAQVDVEIEQLKATDPERYRALFEQAKAEVFALPIMAGKPYSPIHDGAIRARMRMHLRETPVAADPDAASRGAFHAMLVALLLMPKLPAPTDRLSSPAPPKTTEN